MPLKVKNMYITDKNNTVVIIDKPDCIQRVESMTKDGSYEIFRINNLLNNFKTFVSTSLKKCKHIANRDLIRRLTVPKSLYPKIHKILPAKNTQTC